MSTVDRRGNKDSPDHLHNVREASREGGMEGDRERTEAKFWFLMNESINATRSLRCTCIMYVRV